MKFIVSAISLALSIALGGAEKAELDIADRRKDPLVTWAAKSKRATAVIDRAVIHCAASIQDAEGKALPKERWFDPETLFGIWSELEVGPHYYVGRDGRVTHLVAHDRTAWHASTYNARSIGVELAGLSDEKFVVERLMALPEDERAPFVGYTDAQYVALDALLAKLKRDHSGIQAILHCEIHDLGRVTASMLNLRKAPEVVEGNVIESLARGTRLMLLGSRTAGGQTWYRIRLEDRQGEGWVAAKHVELLQRKYDPSASFEKERIGAVPFAPYEP